MTGFDVSPSVSDEVTSFQGYEVLCCRLAKKPRPGFPAVAAIRVVMVADEKVIQRKRPEKYVVDLFDGFLLRRPSAYIGLVR
jgi:hypothetical protein